MPKSTAGRARTAKKTPAGKRSGASRRRRGKARSARWKALAAVLAVAFVLAAALLVHSYSRFQYLLATRMVNSAAPAPQIFSRPTTVKAAEPGKPEAWKRRLELSGYRVVEAPAQGAARTLEVSGEGRRTWQLHFAAGRVQAIREAGRSVNQTTLGPLFLSSLPGSGRHKSRRLPLEAFPPRLVQAVLAAEDQRFYRHPGVDPLTMGRAVAVNLWNWDFGQGGSTLTQQLIKNHLLSPDKQVLRKLEEMYFALLLESRFSKRQILEFYLNDIYLGQIGGFAVHGFGQAALSYYGKELGQLDLSETAALVGMIPAPNRYSPYRRPRTVLARRGYVLDRMEAEGFVSAEESTAARAQDLKFRPPSHQEASQAPYFVDYLADLLERDYGLGELTRPELTVYSTLDPALQKLAFEAVRLGLAEVDQLVAGRKNRPDPQAALIAVDPASGEILALVGGRNYADGPFNRAVYAFRQPGSTTKPFVLAAALQQALEGGAPITLSSQILDEPYSFHYENQTYSPRNHGNRYHGLVSLRQALALSLNVPTVKLAEAVGFPALLESYRRMDLGQDWKAYPSLALGTFELSLLELAQAYQVLAAGGRLVPLRALRQVREGDRERRPDTARPSRQVLDPRVAFLVTSSMESVLAEGTGRSVRQLGFSLPAAGKTGSSDDSWFVAYTPELLVAVWVGTDGPPSLNLDGSRAALPIWARFMKDAARAGYLKGRPFTVPQGVEAVSIDLETGLRAGHGCGQGRTEYFLAGTAPEFDCTAVARASLPAIGTERVQRPKRGFFGWLGRVFKGKRSP